MCDTLLIIATFMSAVATIAIAIFTRINIKLTQEIKEHHVSYIAATIYSANPPSTDFKFNDFKAIRE